MEHHHAAAGGLDAGASYDSSMPSAQPATTLYDLLYRKLPIPSYEHFAWHMPYYSDGVYEYRDDRTGATRVHMGTTTTGESLSLPVPPLLRRRRGAVFAQWTGQTNQLEISKLRETLVDVQDIQRRERAEREQAILRHQQAREQEEKEKQERLARIRELHRREAAIGAMERNLAEQQRRYEEEHRRCAFLERRVRELEQQQQQQLEQHQQQQTAARPWWAPA